MGKEHSSEGMDKFMLMLLMSTGADIIAPKPLKKHILETLDLKGNDGFELANSAMSSVDTDKADIIKGLIVNNLTPSQMVELHKFIHGCVTSILEYCKDHPENREEVNPEKVMSKLFGFKDDEDEDED